MTPCYYVTLLQSLIELLKGHSKFISEAYHNNLSLDENQCYMTHIEEIMYIGKDIRLRTPYSHVERGHIRPPLLNGL